MAWLPGLREGSVLRTTTDTNTGSLRFTVEDWNVHDTVETHLGRTNNAIEGWHSALNKRFRKVNPPLSTLIFELKEEELDAQSRIQRSMFASTRLYRRR
ncbi:hypothetical protein QR680_009621 [Steinernema hermaphroditum]|uniref:Uncharacterized protein n=1 Tax=Steinernema hermaphroditum TaxID=289476 RepID=A0AA39IMC1_9BILA|nr:hypothetical protein QR680_009621 [Steinernema hermaphroditum]